jgi:hypothetical protein
VRDGERPPRAVVLELNDCRRTDPGRRRFSGNPLYVARAFVDSFLQGRERDCAVSDSPGSTTSQMADGDKESISEPPAMSVTRVLVEHPASTSTNKMPRAPARRIATLLFMLLSAQQVSPEDQQARRIAY